GQLLGWSGSTGWSCGPHLHFKVMRDEGAGWNHFSTPATLKGRGDPLAGQSVAAPRCPVQEATQLNASTEGTSSPANKSPVATTQKQLPPEPRPVSAELVPSVTTALVDQEKT